VISGVSLEVKSGEKIGIVGSSGCGKTTLMHLAMRFFDPSSGSIKIDGQDLRDVTQASLRRNFSFVQQDVQLFNRSVLENIALEDPNANMDDVIAAAKMADAHAFIETLSDAKGNAGYDARVGERGVKLSGGQRQRIAIARAIYRDAPILILDEATSQLDTETEQHIQDNLIDYMKERTVFVIAHRLSTIRDMDHILVLDQGKIVEQGSHDDLMALQGLYSQMWMRQIS
jgi:ATP-binding cassette subfamily B multidrug efflux pump